MKKLKNKILHLFKTKNFITIFMMFLLIFIGALYVIIDKLDINLVKAEDVINLNNDAAEESETYERYYTNQKQFNKKIEEIEKSIDLEEDEFKNDDEDEGDDNGEINQPEVEEVKNENENNEDNDDNIENSENEDNIDEDDDMQGEILSEEPEKLEDDDEENNDVTLPEEPSKENGKVAYITFDDGPSSMVTPQILDILSNYDIKATFFVLGKSAEENPEILKRIHEEGHVIGNHSYSHNYKYVYKDISNFVEEIELTEEVFKNILGEEFETDLFRFPGGSFEDWKKPFRERVVELGYKYIDWNSLNGDAEGHNLTKEQLVKRFKATYRNQKKLIILMHDTDAKPTTAEALPEIIEFLIEKGYDFATF